MLLERVRADEQRAHLVQRPVGSSRGERAELLGERSHKAFRRQAWHVHKPRNTGTCRSLIHRRTAPWTSKWMRSASGSCARSVLSVNIGTLSTFGFSALKDSAWPHHL